MNNERFPVMLRKVPHIVKISKQYFLFRCVRDNAPGQRECDEALEQINYTINQMDQSSLAAISQQLEPRPENSLQVRFEQDNACKGIELCLRKQHYDI